MVLQAPNPVWHIFDHKYHKRLDTHGMVLERSADIECGDTMIHTMKNGNYCLPMPASASARCCQTEMGINNWFCELALS